MQLVIKSNAKTSVTTYIHATTYIQVKPIFTQALMIWLQLSDHNHLNSNLSSLKPHPQQPIPRNFKQTYLLK